MSSADGASGKRSSVSSSDGLGGGGPRTVGTLLAAIATCMTDALRILMFADKRHWGPDEFEQIRVLEAALDEAKKDFQEMAPLVHGQFYYENDRTAESLQELSALLTKFTYHTRNFKDWVRQGGPINPVWARETAQLRRELHRAQCRAARRIFAVIQGSSDGPSRCLGAFQVYREYKRREEERQRRQQEQGELPSWRQQQHQQQQQQQQQEQAQAQGNRPDGRLEGGRYGSSESEGQHPGQQQQLQSRSRRGSLEELVPHCNAVGRFQRLASGEGSDAQHDAAFVCDYCEGYIVWPDLQDMPSARAPLAPTAVGGYPHWQARGTSAATGEDKTVVYAPLAIANHVAPEPGEWQAGLVCPYCEEATYVDEGEDSAEVRYAQDENGFPDLEAFREHLEWYHTALPVPPISTLASKLPAAVSSNCAVM